MPSALVLSPSTSQNGPLGLVDERLAEVGGEVHHRQVRGGAGFGQFTRPDGVHGRECRPARSRVEDQAVDVDVDPGGKAWLGLHHVGPWTEGDPVGGGPASFDLWRACAASPIVTAALPTAAEGRTGAGLVLQDVGRQHVGERGDHGADGAYGAGVEGPRPRGAGTGGERPQQEQHAGAGQKQEELPVQRRCATQVGTPRARIMSTGPRQVPMYW